MAKMKKTPKVRVPSRPVSSAAKDPITTAKFLDDIDEAIATFDDKITSISADQREVAYENLAKSYRETFTLVWDKASNADVQPIINAIPNKQLLEFKKLKWLLHPGQAKPKVIEEPRPVPALEQILGAMTSRLPEQDLLDKDVCKTIANVCSDLAATHMSQAKAAKGLAELATMVSPEQMTLILAAAVPPPFNLHYQLKASHHYPHHHQRSQQHSQANAINHVLQNTNSARCLGPEFPKIQQMIPHLCPGGSPLLCSREMVL